MNDTVDDIVFRNYLRQICYIAVSVFQITMLCMNYEMI